jgi:hypothetical protein
LATNLQRFADGVLDPDVAALLPVELRLAARMTTGRS